MRNILEDIRKIARTPVSVLISGETGTRKGVCAGAIHDASGRPGTFVSANCAAFPEALTESMMFGHLKGSFTGAVESRIGLLATARSGTLFLDEMTEVMLVIQAKLLDALESGEYRPVARRASSGRTSD